MTPRPDRCEVHPEPPCSDCCTCKVPASVTVPASEGECPKCHGTKLAPGFATMPCPECQRHQYTNPFDPSPAKKGGGYHKKLKIEELEAILNSEEDIPVLVQPSGEITWNPQHSREIKQCPRCKKRYLKEVPFFGDFCSPRCEEVPLTEYEKGFARGLSAREEQLREAVRLLKFYKSITWAGSGGGEGEKNRAVAVHQEVPEGMERQEGTGRKETSRQDCKWD